MVQGFPKEQIQANATKHPSTFSSGKGFNKTIVAMADLHQATVVLTPEEFKILGLEECGYREQRIGRAPPTRNTERFVSHYGAHPQN